MARFDRKKIISATARQNFDDTWSPAVQQPDGPVMYWPNITCATREEALRRSRDTLLHFTGFDEAEQWNVWPDTGLNPTD